jgi:MATE family multidrug resistance protein
VTSPLRRTAFDREILALAIPALGALAADPLVSLVDTAFVGNLGRIPLGALGASAAVFGVAFSLFIFLAYGTTPMIARTRAAGDEALAERVGGHALTLAFGVGIVMAAVLAATADATLGLIGADAEVMPSAVSYLRIRSLALPAVLVVTAGHGIYRGYADTKTPFVITALLNAVNLVLDPLLIYTLGLGIQGAAWATVIAQAGGASWFLWSMLGSRRGVAVTWVRPVWVEMRPIVGAARALVVRTGSLIGAMTLATAVAARLGTVPLGAHQVATQLWLFLALVVDALAIAAQMMIGRELGRGDTERARLVADRLVVMGAVFGVALAAAMAAGWGIIPELFSDDPAVVRTVSQIYGFVVVMQPLNAVVFVWDGVAIGSEDYTYLAASMLVSALSAVVVLLAVLPRGWGLPGVWWGLVVLMVARAATLARWRLRGPLALR